MKTLTPHRSARAFTLIEMLVVIAIIATLAGILLPVLSRVKTKAKIAQATTETRNLAAAIAAYQALYGIYPCPETDSKLGVDKTYDNTIPATMNSNIMVILLDLDQPPNAAHIRNPQKHVFLNAKLVDSTSMGGLSRVDYNFRDPWGVPYVISVDLNYDNQCKDTVYGTLPVSVMIWSCGPDRKPKGPSGDPVKRDNDDVRSW